MTIAMGHHAFIELQDSRAKCRHPSLLYSGSRTPPLSALAQATSAFTPRHAMVSQCTVCPEEGYIDV